MTAANKSLEHKNPFKRVEIYLTERAMMFGTRGDHVWSVFSLVFPTSAAAASRRSDGLELLLVVAVRPLVGPQVRVGTIQRSTRLLGFIANVGHKDKRSPRLSTPFELLE